MERPRLLRYERHGVAERQANNGRPAAKHWRQRKDRPLCAISLCLISAGQPVPGIVDTPLLGERFIARAGGGAYLNAPRITIPMWPICAKR